MVALNDQNMPIVGFNERLPADLAPAKTQADATELLPMPEEEAATAPLAPFTSATPNKAQADKEEKAAPPPAIPGAERSDSTNLENKIWEALDALLSANNGAANMLFDPNVPLEAKADTIKQMQKPVADYVNANLARTEEVLNGLKNPGSADYKKNAADFAAMVEGTQATLPNGQQISGLEVFRQNQKDFVAMANMVGPETEAGKALTAAAAQIGKIEAQYTQIKQQEKQQARGGREQGDQTPGDSLQQAVDSANKLGTQVMGNIGEGMSKTFGEVANNVPGMEAAMKAVDSFRAQLPKDIALDTMFSGPATGPSPAPAQAAKAPASGRTGP